MDFHFIDNGDKTPPCFGQTVKMTVGDTGRVDLSVVPNDCEVVFRNLDQWWLASSGAPLMVNTMTGCLAVHSQSDAHQLLSYDLRKKLGLSSAVRPVLRPLSDSEFKNWSRGKERIAA